MQKKFPRTLFVPGLFVLAITTPQPSLSMDDEELSRVLVRYVSCHECVGSGIKPDVVTDLGVRKGFKISCKTCEKAFTSKEKFMIAAAKRYQLTDALIFSETGVKPRRK